jgi:hypothetical protein
MELFNGLAKVKCMEVILTNQNYIYEQIRYGDVYYHSF